MFLNKIKKIDWQYLVNRNQALLFNSITGRCYQYFKKATGLSWRPDFKFFLGNGDHMYSARELNNLHSLFKRGGIKLLVGFLHGLVFNIQAFDKISCKIEEIDCLHLNKAQLVKLLDDFVTHALYAHNFLVPMTTADKVLTDMILDLLPRATDQQQQEWLAILTFPIKENEHTKEERSFLKVARAYQAKSQKFDKLIETHLQKFAWIGARGYWWRKAWKKTNIQNRLVSFFAQNKDPNTELRHLRQLKREQVRLAKEIFQEFNIKQSSSLYQLSRLAKEYAYRRTWRTDVLYRSGYRARELFYEIGRRAGLKEDDIVYLTFDEVLGMAKTKKAPISLEELIRRKEYLAYVALKNQILVLSGKEWQEKLKTISAQRANVSSKIKGRVAFPGKVQGIVKVIYTSDDIKKVKLGDILVAAMTFPNFMPALERAVAFVTDEGGILCHAAIISREMRKPCIIGTKIATKVLQDGQTVEVDADNGMVKVIKQIAES